jgi:hypothetical protein
VIPPHNTHEPLTNLEVSIVLTKPEINTAVVQHFSNPDLDKTPIISKFEIESEDGSMKQAASNNESFLKKTFHDTDFAKIQ